MNLQNIKTKENWVYIVFKHPYLDEEILQILENKKITLERVWELVAFNQEEMIKDACGAWIKKSHFRLQTEFGWDFDFIKPLFEKRKICLKNLRPMHWKNIQRKGKDYPNYYSAVTANGNSNIDFEKYYKVSEILQNIIKSL